MDSNLAKSLQLIELILASPQGLSAQEIVDQADLSRSTVFTLLKSLIALGYLDQEGSRGKYFCGPKLQAWRNSPDTTDAELIARFNQEVKGRDWLESVFLIKHVGKVPLVIARHESLQPVRFSLSEGAPGASLESAIESLDPSFTDGVPYLTKSKDVIELSAPVCADGSTPIAVVTVVAPAFRWTKKAFLNNYRSQLIAFAERLSFSAGAPFYQPYGRTENSAIQSEVELSNKEIDEFLSRPLIARLGCISPAGTPHVIPVWQQWDGKGFTIFSWKGSNWAEYLASNPAVSLTIDEPWPPMRRVVARGEAVPLTLPIEALQEMAAAMSRQYLGVQTVNPKRLEIEKAYRVNIHTIVGFKGLKVAAAAQ